MAQTGKKIESYEDYAKRNNIAYNGVIDVKTYKERQQASNKLRNSTSSKLYQLVTGQKYDEKQQKFVTKQQYSQDHDTSLISNKDTGNILGTAADIGTNLLKGVFSAGEEISDLASYIVAGGANVLGNLTNSQKIKNYAKDVKEGAQLNLTDNIFQPISDKVDKYSWSGDFLDSVTQSIGNSFANAKVSSSLFKNVGKNGQISVKVGKFNMEVPITSVISGFSNGMTDAYNKGATNTQAIIKGITGGISEGFSEGFFGVFGQGGSSIEDSVMSKINARIENKVANKLAKVGASAIGEGSEEIISYMMNWTADNLQDIVSEAAGKDLEKMGDKFSLSELGQNFAAGALAGGFSTGATNVSTNLKAKMGNTQAKTQLAYEEAQTNAERALKSPLTDEQKTTLNGLVENAVKNNKTLDTNEILEEFTRNDTIKQELISTEENKLKEEIAKKIGQNVTANDVTLTDKQVKDIQKKVEQQIESGDVSIETLESHLISDEDTKKYNEIRSQVITPEEKAIAQKYIDEYNAKTTHTQEEDAIFSKYTNEINNSNKVVNDNMDFIKTYETNRGKIVNNPYNPYFKSYQKKILDNSKLEYDTSNMKGVEKTYFDDINNHEILGKNRNELESIGRVVRDFNAETRLHTIEEAIKDDLIKERTNLTQEELSQIAKLEEEIKNTQDELKLKDLKSKLYELKYEDSNGMYDGKIHIIIDAKGNINQVFAHELKHMIEQSKLTSKYNKMIKDYGNNLHNFDKELSDTDFITKRVLESYLNKDVKNVKTHDDLESLVSGLTTEEQTKLESELTAYLTQQYLGNEEFIAKLTETKSLLQKFKEFIGKLKAAFKGTSYYSDVEKLENTFNKMLKEVGKQRAKGNITDNGVQDSKYLNKKYQNTELNSAVNRKYADTNEEYFPIYYNNDYFFVDVSGTSDYNILKHLNVEQRKAIDDYERKVDYNEAINPSTIGFDELVERYGTIDQIGDSDNNENVGEQRDKMQDLMWVLNIGNEEQQSISREDNDSSRETTKELEKLSKNKFIYNDTIPTKNLTAPDGYTILYHNTSASNLDSISKNGIKGGQNLSGYSVSPEEGQAIWATNTPQKGNGGSTVAFIVPTNIAEQSKVNNTDYMLYEDITPENIIQIDRGLKNEIQMSDLQKYAFGTEENFIKGAKSLGLDEESAKELYNYYQNNKTQYSKNILGELVDQDGNKQVLETSDVGTTGTLMAIHNLNEDKLKGILELGGFPVPSIAITDTNKNYHNQFGNISVLFDKSTIDPSNPLNETYDRDAYSITFPTIEYNIDYDKLLKIEHNMYNNYRDSIASSALNSYMSKDNLEDAINRSGKVKVYDDAKNDNRVKYLYYKTIHPEFEQLTKQVSDNVSSYYSNEFLQEFINEYGKEIPNWSTITDEQRNEIIDKFRNKLIPYLEERANNIIAEENAKENPRPYIAGFARASVENMKEILESFGGQDRVIQDLNKIQSEGLTRTVNDEQATFDYINNNINQEEYNKWFDETIGQLINNADKGIYNGKDYVTNSGRRSFKQTHYEYNLQNLVKEMIKHDTTGGENTIGVSFGKISAKRANKFNSIEDIKNAENRLTNSEEANEQLKELDNNLNSHINSLNDYISNINGDYYSYGSDIVLDFAGYKNLNSSNFDKVLKEYNIKSIPSEIKENIINDLKQLNEVPTDYFETKPQRAVGLDEIQQVILPNTTSAELKQQLQNMGIQYTEYDPSIEGDRNRVINQFDSLKFSRSGILPTNSNETVLDNNVEDLETPLLEYLNDNYITQETQNMLDNENIPINETQEQKKARHDKYAKQYERLNQRFDKKKSQLDAIQVKYDEVMTAINAIESEYNLDDPTDIAELNSIARPLYTQMTNYITNMEKISQELDEIDRQRQDVESFMAENPERISNKEAQGNLLAQMNITEEDLNKGKRINQLDLSRTDSVRVAEKIFDKKTADKINNKTVNKTKHNEAELIRFKNAEREDIKGLGIKARSIESELVQRYGEKEIDEMQLRSQVDDETANKIIHAANVIRQKYDSYLDKMNEVLVKMGYDPVAKRADYMRHFQELSDKLSEWGIPFNANEMKSEDLPTDINGITDQFKPGKSWFASSLQRKGFKTTYDAITGIDGYLDGVANVIYHTEDIQRYRALSKYIRNLYGKEGFETLDGLTEEQAQERTDKILNNHLSQYAAWLDEQANTLANKKSKIDRGIEEVFGRRAYTGLNELKKQVGSNMTGFNFRSALTNFISTTLAAGRTSKAAMIKGLSSTIQNMFHDDGFIDRSDFLTSRFGSQRLSNKLWQRIANAGQIFMEGTDRFTSNFIVRSKYYEGLAKGMNELQAMNYANDFGARVLGDRSKGATASIFNSKTLGVITQFQLETNNQLDYLLHDSKEEFENYEGSKSNAAKAITMQLGQMAVYSYIFNEIFEKLTGSRAALDPIEIFKTLFGLGDDDDDKTAEERIDEAASLLIGNLPFTSILSSNSRFPVLDAVTGTTTLLNKFTGGTDKYGNEITWGDVADAVKSDAGYLLPTGYSQLKKTYNGLKQYVLPSIDEDKYPIAGSYTDSGKLRFEADTSPFGIAQSALFGQWASKNAQDYIDSGFKTTSTDDVTNANSMGMSVNDYETLKSNINEVKSTTKKVDDTTYTKYEDMFGTTYWYDKDSKKVYDSNMKETNIKVTSLNKVNGTEKLYDYIDSLDLTDNEKNVLLNQFVKTTTTDKYGYETYYGTTTTSTGKAKKVTYHYDESTDTLYDDDYNVVSNININSLTPKESSVDISDYDKYGSYDEYKYATENPEKYLIMDAIGGYDNYNTYTDELDDIRSQYKTTSDMTSKQKTAVSNAKKQATINYINSLNISAVQKAMLVKQYYTYKTYDKAIINYINNSEYSYDEKIALYKELGFTVKNGYVY